MRFEQYIAEEKKPTTKKYKFFVDNPGGGWLEHERNLAKKRKMGGSVTGGFHEYFLIPIKMVLSLKGMQGERRTLSEPRVQELMKSIEQYGIRDPIFINVQYDGSALINEGNRRTLIAKTLGMKHVPVEIKYYAGGEQVDGPWHPDKITKIAKNWKRPPKPPVEKKPKPKSKPDRKKQEPKKGKPVSKDIQDILKQLGWK